MNDWMNNPAMKNIDPIKLELIKTAASKTSGKSGKELAPIMMALISGANKQGIRFTPEEMTLILDILKDGKSKEEREQIVAESLGYMEANCDGCTSGLAEMYQAYIDGKKELRDINMEFHAGYVSGEEVPGRRSCPM